MLFYEVNMLQKIAVLLFLSSGILMFQQSDYKLEFERMELFRHKEEYVGSPKIFTYKYNRTAPVVNATFTFTKNLGNDMQVVVQAYKFMSNEYRYFPIRFQFDFCRYMHNNEFGLGGFLACGNFSKCPIRKARYHICHWAPDGSRFPPHLPDGRYMVDLEAMFNNVEIMLLRLYFRVYRPIV